jgi:hypothetical protein
MNVIHLMLLICFSDHSITESQLNSRGLTSVSFADTFSIYKLWELDTILGKEATIFGGIQHFQILDLRDPTILKMHPFETDGPATKYTIIGNEIVLLDKKGRPQKQQKQKKQSGTYILVIKDLGERKLIISVSGEIRNSKEKRLMEFFELVYLTNDK